MKKKKHAIRKQFEVTITDPINTTKTYHNQIKSNAVILNKKWQLYTRHVTQESACTKYLSMESQ